MNKSDELKRQLASNARSALLIFLNDQGLESLKTYYSTNFDKVIGFIQKTSSRNAVEDVLDDNPAIAARITDEQRMLLQQVQTGMMGGHIQPDDFR